MPTLIKTTTLVQAAGSKPKQIEEFLGRANTGHTQVSIARMHSPPGWKEPGQKPEFLECSLVFQGTLRVEYEGGVIDVTAGQAVVACPGEWVRYSTPRPQGAEYVSVCVPAFSPNTVHRDQNV